MANKYSSYSGLDDVRRGDREAGFIGFNNRLRPDQIQSGLLQKSENGRLDLNGQWQARKGIQNRLAPFAVSGTALRLPTEDEITDGDYYATAAYYYECYTHLVVLYTYY